MAETRELVKRDDGQWVSTLTEKQQAFVEWLVDPERAARGEGMKEAAVLIGVSLRTLYNWKKDRSFNIAWEDALRERNVSPDRIGNIMDAAYAKAIGGDVKAMELYMKLIDRMTPERTESVVANLSEMSTEQIKALAAGL